MAKSFSDDEPQEVPKLMNIPLFKIFKPIDNDEMLSKARLEISNKQKKEEYSFEELVKFYGSKNH
jgi:hypothetical protein